MIDLSARKIHFIAGLPRSGSTLLANVLHQNPQFGATATSGIIEILFSVRNQWDKIVEFRSNPDPGNNEHAKLSVMQGILQAYASTLDRPVFFDKSRSWLAHIEMAEHILQRKVKILVPVRDVRDVLASFEKLWRANSASSQTSQEAKHYFEFQTVEGRCKVWMQSDQPVGLAYNRIRDAIHRGFTDRLCFVRFESLTRSPRETMREIYDFLGEPYYPHNFEHVEQVTSEDDRVFGFADLHTIRSQVRPVQPHWPATLGDAARAYDSLSFWQI